LIPKASSRSSRSIEPGGAQSQCDTAFIRSSKNVHRAGILRVSRAPAPELVGVVAIRPEVKTARVLNALNNEGLLDIEFLSRMADCRQRNGLSCTNSGIGD